MDKLHEEEHDHTFAKRKIHRIPIKLGDEVRIQSIQKDATEPEDYYYLKTFEHKIGIIIEENYSQSGLPTYKVKFAEDKFGYFYAKDFVPIDEDSQFEK
ncbi:hypothetical protein [Bacillus rubiinfantis]|uniref:hypothetical protein n=1 Tax=Bacillus rubiinfantis TaxID=1499680 RepID=UPI0005A8AD0B|nr:hypothetical protein [Bacillus rubiinfantis]